MISIEISDKNREMSEEELRHWRDINSEAKERFEARREYAKARIAPLEKDVNESEIFSKRDYYIIVY